MSHGNYTLMCNNLEHPVLPTIRRWMDQHPRKDELRLVHTPEEINWQGEVLFLISHSQIVREHVRDKFRHTLVFHASDLPKGRGWSPYVWDIINGADSITLAMIDAAEPVDSGAIWAKHRIPLPRTALYDEINQALFGAMLTLMDRMIDDPASFSRREQDDSVRPTYYPRRSKQDSRIDIDKTIREQFNLLRVCDPDRFPAFFELDNQKFVLTLRKVAGDIAE